MEGTQKLAARGARCTVFALLALASSGFSLAQSKITVAQAFRDANGGLVAGYLRIRATAPFAAPDGTWVDAVWARAKLVNSAISLPLWPGTYTVEWHLDNGVARTDTWTVAAGNSPISVAAAEGQATSTTGSTAPLSWANLTNSQWTGMTGAQWTGMVN